MILYYFIKMYKIGRKLENKSQKLRLFVTIKKIEFEQESTIYYNKSFYMLRIDCQKTFFQDHL